MSVSLTKTRTVTLDRVPTSGILPGDVVLTHGMRVRVTAPMQAGTSDPAAGLTRWTRGTVLNLPDLDYFMTSVLRQDAIPGDAPDFPGWTLQGNDLRRWTVVRSMPLTPTVQP